MTGPIHPAAALCACALLAACSGPAQSVSRTASDQPSASALRGDEGAASENAPAPRVESEPLATAVLPDETNPPVVTAEQTAIDAVLALPPSRSLSIGSPNQGRLEGGVPLPERGPGFRSNPNRPNAAAYFGTVETIQSLVRAAGVVSAAMPGSTLYINDIGFEAGGPIEHHGSHRAGRDVDVLFYYFDSAGEPWPSKGVPIDPDGQGFDFGDLVDPSDDVAVRLDVARTWRFVQALLEGEAEERSAVQRIFVVEHVRTALLAEAARAGAPPSIRERFADITCQPSYPHDDHLHVRYFCSADDLAAGCEDVTPLYPWHREALAAAEVEPVMAAPRPHRRRTPTRAAAIPDIPMDDTVRSFLERRAEWAAQPHPGRRFCR